MFSADIDELKNDVSIMDFVIVQQFINVDTSLVSLNDKITVVRNDLDSLETVLINYLDKADTSINLALNYTDSNYQLIQDVQSLLNTINTSINELTTSVNTINASVNILENN